MVGAPTWRTQWHWWWWDTMALGIISTGGSGVGDADGGDTNMADTMAPVAVGHNGAGNHQHWGQRHWGRGRWGHQHGGHNGTGGGGTRWCWEPSALGAVALGTLMMGAPTWRTQWHRWRWDAMALGTISTVGSGAGDTDGGCTNMADTMALVAVGHDGAGNYQHWGQRCWGR